MIKDISIFESGSGGDLLIINDDLTLTNLLFQIVYLSLFGGNIEASTLGNERPGVVRDDWWANSLLFKDQIEQQMNSQTEMTLNKVALNSSGRLLIQDSVRNDLRHMATFADVSSDVILNELNKVQIIVRLNQYQNKEINEFEFIWDNVEKTVISSRII